ncbi:acryloyl-CoA reductase [Planctomicrobium sp. SH668]|uniref:acrylyl-CoA reductase family protein n=1 Tax=Planctomicrobium sp. SH668 TaxID=3448126 RepID=UPI003F5BC3C9
MPADRFSCFLVRQNEQGKIHSAVEEKFRSELPQSDVLLQVEYSSLNYKDAMAATGNPAIAKNFPHIPGIDAAGIVLESRDPRYRPGDRVIATGHEFGVERWGGWSQYLTAPANWLVPLPAGMTTLEAMTFGTAGFTAAQSVLALLHQGITPDKGRIVVSGATGGVGCLSVMILKHLGFDVVAVSGKPERSEWLKSLGAAEVVGRQFLSDKSDRPLLKGEFAGGIDTVGGSVLTNLCKRIAHRGCVACCGMAGGNVLGLTVFPFILRGLTLTGIDSAWCPDDLRAGIWKRLASDWKLPNLQDVRTLVGLTELNQVVDDMLGSRNVGRVVVDLTCSE